MAQSLEEILGNIRAGSGNKPFTTFQNPLQSIQNPSVKKDVTYTVPINAVYDRLSDGTYTPRYENYQGAVGNEDRLAKEQSWYEQAFHGLEKFVVKTALYAFDNTIGTVYGIGSAIANADFSKLYDNDLANTLDDYNTRMDNALPNYYTNEEKARGLLNAIPGYGGFTNFLFNDVAGGAAFIMGAVLPSFAMNALTGGATVSGTLAKSGFRSAFKEAGEQVGKTAVREAMDASNYKSGLRNVVEDAVEEGAGREILRGSMRAKFASKGGNILETGAFLVRSSSFEAGMEARHSYKDAMDTYMLTFEEKNGRMPTIDEIKNFSNDARVAASAVYWTNMGILSVSNMAMFGKTFGIGKNLSKSADNLFNRSIGLGYTKDATGKLIFKEANKAQRFLGNTYKLIGKSVVEGQEEALQGVASISMQKYLESKYDPKAVDGYSLSAAIGDAFAQQYGTSEGWKEIGIGMLLGFAGGPMTGQGLPGIGRNSRATRSQEIGAQVETANRGLEELRGMNFASSAKNFRNQMESKAQRYESTSVDNTLTNLQFIKSQEAVKSSKSIREDFNTTMDGLKYEGELQEDFDTEDQFNNYKESVKSEFTRNMDDYTFAKKTVDALDLPQRLDIGKGNIVDLADAMTTNIMMGKSALYSAQNVAQQLDNLTGSNGIFNHLQFFNGLKDDQKANVEKLKENRTQVEFLRKEAIEYSNKLAGISVLGKRYLSDSKAQNFRDRTSEKLVLTQQEITRLEAESADIGKSLESYYKSVGSEIDGTMPSLQGTESIFDTLDQIDRLDAYVESLQNVGKEYDAQSVKYLINEFKTFSDAHREMSNSTRRMLATNYFGTNEGKRLLDIVKGPKYVMSDDFKKVIRDNDVIIDESLKLTGQRGYATVEEKIKAVIEDNDNLSDREKFKLESILRLQLAAQSIQDSISEITADSISTVPMEETKVTPLKGDTVVLREQLDIKASDLNNLDVLNDVIGRISDALEAVRATVTPTQDTSDVQEQIDALEAERQQIVDSIDELDTEQQARIDAIDQEVNTLEGQKTGRPRVRIVDSPEFIRLNELIVKQETSELTAAEAQELVDLQQDVDQWMYITGTVANGLRLSDLIRQRAVIENTEITPVEEVEEVTSEDALSGIDLGERKGNANYSYGQSYDAVTAVKDDQTGKIAISGMRPDFLMQEAGIPFEFEINEKGNVLVTEEVALQINAAGNILITPRNQDLTTNYSVVLKIATDVNGNKTADPLKSNYSDDFSQPQNINAIYEQEVGDGLVVEIDPTDQYNAQLLAEYRQAHGNESLTEEEAEELAVQLAEDYIKNDPKIKELRSELLRLQDKAADPNILTTEKAKVSKAILKTKENIGKREDTLTDKANTDAYKPSKKDQVKIDAVRERIRKSLVIRVKDKKGNFLNVLKGKSKNGIKSPVDEVFEAFRDKIGFDDALIDQLANVSVREEIPNVNMTVKKVFLGFPSFNFAVNTDGSVSIQYKRVNDVDATKVTDIGYLEAGRMETRSGELGVDTTFLSKFIKTSAQKKVPFIVLTKGTKRIAYPVRVQPLAKPDNSEFTGVFNSDADNVSKVDALNRFMASRGIDIKETGNAFIATGNHTNLTQDFFDQKLAQLENIEYFPDMTLWRDQSQSMQQILTDQVSVNINLSDPFHSPKLQMDFSGIEGTPTVAQTSNSTAQKDINDQATQRSIIHSILGRDNQQQAEDDTNKPCP